MRETPVANFSGVNNHQLTERFDKRDFDLTNCYRPYGVLLT